MADYPALPLWTDAYLADTRHLSDAEHGRYLLLLMDMWRSPGCRFPNDPAWLARKFRRTVEALEAEIMPLLREFCQCDGNWWTQKRLARESQYVQRTSRNNSAAAKSRWRKEKGECVRNAQDGNAFAMPPHPHPHPDSTPQSVQETSSLSQTAPKGANGHAKPKSEERGTRLQPDWRPSEEAIDYCRRELGATSEILNREYPAFMDWGLSATGPASRKRSWDRAFVNWMRRVMSDVRDKEARERRWAEQRGRPAH